MRCNICDKSLSHTEIVFNKDLNAYEPCPVCLDIAMDAAFSQFDRRDDSEIPEEIGDEFGDGLVDTLDTDVGLSDLSWGDLSRAYSERSARITLE